MRWAPLVLLIACGPVIDDARVGTGHQAIIGGEKAPDEPRVFAIGTADGGMFCSATLINSRTLLTAAHCADTPLTLTASNAGDVRTWPSDAIAIVDKRLHPRWAGNSDFDVGLLLLEHETDGMPARWNRAPVDQTTVPNVRAVGFGETHAFGYGVRYEASLPVVEVTPMTLFIGDPDSPTTCFGDSGGPSFASLGDGGEQLVGVHSFSLTNECSGGGDVRVDSIADFIDAWTRDKTPTCALDAACVAGCDDPDCRCLTDGVCAADCLLPDTDADCPKSCLRDGLCAYGACGVPDPDCLEDGDACSTSERCPGHQCVHDSSQTDSYCSRPCDEEADCTHGMHCSFNVCRNSTGPAPSPLKPVPTSYPAAHTCAVAPQLLFIGALLLLLRPRRARRQIRQSASCAL